MTDSVRDRLLALVRQYPGLHQRELARQLDTSLALVQYHAKALLEEGEVTRREEGGAVRLYPPDADVDHGLLMALRDKRQLPIILQLLDTGAARHGDLVAATGMGKSTLSFHTGKLRKAGIIEKTDDGFCLRDPEKVRATLEALPPTPDLLDRFTDLWGDLYG